MNTDERRQAELLILASQVDDLMAAQAITQAQLARKMDAPRATVCLMLQGRDARLSTYLRVLEVLDAEIVIRRRVA